MRKHVYKLRCKFKGFLEPVGFDNLLGLTEPTESCYSHSYTLLQAKDMGQISLSERRIGRRLAGFQCRTSVSSPVQSECYSPCVTFLASISDNMQSIANQEARVSLGEFLLGLHYIGMIDWLPMEWNSVSRAAYTVLPKAPTLSHMVGLFGIANPDLYTVGYSQPYPKVQCGQPRS